MKRLLLLPLLASAPLLAAVDGTVVNGTKDQPQADVIISLMQPGQGGLQTLETTKSDAQGKFHFAKDAPGPKIIQTIYGGVIYNQVVPPGTPTDNVAVNVYEPTRKPGTAQLAQHLVLFQPGDTQMSVSENFIFENTSKLSFNDPEEGSARVYVPETGRQNVKITVTAPGGMPISRDAESTHTPGLFKIDYPLKPGETRFEVNYTVPAAQPMIFEGQITRDSQPLRLVVPDGVTLKGKDLQSLGQEPTTQANIYTVTGDKYRVEVVGTVAPAPAENQGDDGRPQIRVARPRIYDQMWVILTLALFALGLGAVILFRRPAPTPRKD